MGKQKRLLVFACLALIVAGCGGDGEAQRMAEINSDNVKRLGNLYAFYQTQNGFEGPDDEAQFKEFISGLSERRLEAAGVDPADIDGLFMGERDQQPLKIKYGLDTRVRGPSQAVVFEETGVDGQRRVGFTHSAMEEVDSTKYDELWNQKVDANSVEARGRGESGS